MQSRALVRAGPAVASHQSQTRPLTLNQALELVEKKSETVGIARAELDRAEGDKRRARSAYFPQLTGSASYLRSLESQFSPLSSGNDTSAVDVV